VPPIARVALVLLCLCAACTPALARKTVCTITVNSDDEREVLRRSLPASEYDFVELVERGRPDWLAAACRKGVACDVLVISGHFDGGTEFYSDRLQARESLSVEEMERVACSQSCPGLFTQLKEVYLFGCNTLQALPTRSAAGEVTRSLVRAGHSAADAEAIAHVLAERHGESNRDRMRLIFKDVPIIYGFPGKAPLGRVAGPLLERYLRAGGEFGEGRASPALLAAFSASGMATAAGMTEGDSRAGFRRDVCHFSDDRLTTAQKVGFMHEFLDRDAAQVRMFLDHLEKYAATLRVPMRESPDVAAQLASIAADRDARARFLAVARDADDPAVRVRMAALAQRLGWLTPEEERSLVVQMLGERLAENTLGAVDVDLACTVNRDGALSGAFVRLPVSSQRASTVGHAAVLACLGSDAGRKVVLRALASGSEADAAIGEAYLSHHPLADGEELRAVTADIARMGGDTQAQVRALHALARHEVADHDSLVALADSFRRTKSIDVQRAVAAVLINASYEAIAPSDLARALRLSRLPSPDGRDLIDVLIRRLDTAAAQRAS
jgi:hypothetical protein